MSKIIKKIMNANQEYTVLGSWGSEWEAHEFITQTDYDLLTPAQKAEKVYMITGEGTPGGDGSAEDTSYDNTTSWLTATNVQDAIDEINTKIAWTQTVTLDWNMVLNKISGKTWTTSSIYIDAANVNVYNSNSVLKYTAPYSTYASFLIYDKYLFYSTLSTRWESYNDIYKLDLTNYGTQYVTHETNSSMWMKCTLDYIYFSSVWWYYKILIDDFSTIESVTENEYNSAVNYANSIDGLFYTQDNNDYVATDINGTEVKRYVWIGTVTWIANGKLWRTVWDVSYAIATI